MVNFLSPSNKSKNSSSCSFSELPDEIIMIILRNLDLKSLCRVSKVNKRFNNLTQDHRLHTSLNLEPYYLIINTQALNYLAPRCKYLRRLNLSYCNGIFSDDIGKFLVSHGSLLTHLQLNHLEIYDNTILEISRICKNLKELGLFYCYGINDDGFSYLENLKFLEYLNVNETHITTETLCKILRRNTRMRHLYIGGEDENLNPDKIVMELRNSCPDLESIKLRYNRNVHARLNILTSKGINDLAGCKNLREMYLDWCNCSGASFFRVFSSCQHLERVSLYYCEGLTERDIRALALCKNLKKLDLTGILRCVTSEICHTIFMNCHKLEMINLRYSNIAKCLILQWQQKYTHITITA
ncbi:PREDICTED: F-box/LRR-repeat protein 3-like [Trachymyrmex cornetzi]|uniref:F-box/LRR-repeat protein 3-like n=1 Tax=Trachymyrmex cornetzi TaxID=471704 RepID=UPI00084F7F17|nr:PREDICTED: F-box/LRR-repeat protein 3-like [Trachymyrmex cornetzi]